MTEDHPPEFDESRSGPMRVIEDVRNAAHNAWTTLALECGHELVKAYRPKWGRTTACRRCGVEGRE